MKTLKRIREQPVSLVKLSVLLPTHNEEVMLVDCLESIQWADEILIVDSFSSDRTLQIAEEYSARIIQHEYINSARQKNWAIPQCRYDWVLQIDADERLDMPLQLEIQAILKNPPSDVDGYINPTKNHLLGEWIRSAEVYPDNRLRLFRRDRGQFEDKEVNARVVVPGKVQYLKNHVLHFGMETISRKLSQIDRYTRYEADERQKRGRRYSWFNIILRPLAVFVYHYVYRLGFLDGMRGLILCAFKADFLFWTYAKLWEKDIQMRRRR